MVPSSLLRKTFALLLALPAAAPARQGFQAADSLTPVEQSALAQLDGQHATQYELIDSWFAGRPIQYYHFGTSDPQPGSFYRITGGADIVTSLPGAPGYSAVRQVLDVEILPAAGVAPSSVTSHVAVLALLQQGHARLRSAGLSLNLPIVPAGSSLQRDPAGRSLRAARYKGRVVHYFDFGPTRPTAIPLIAFAARFPEPGEELEPVAGQATNASAVPGDFSYSDLWNVQVAVGSAYQPGSYRDFRRVQTDSRAGRILVRPRRVIVNCPVMYVDGKPASRSAPAFPPVVPALAARPAAQPERITNAVQSNGLAPDVPAPAPATEPGAPASGGGAAAGRVYSGLARRTDIELPRGAASTVLTMDGVLDEPVWQSAALLTGFSQFEPQDGLPAADSTDVLLWYNDHAIHFGIRAFEPHGVVRAQLADRDKIDSDDHVQIFLDTFNDRRRAMYFAVNPLGRQADGVRNDRGSSSSTDLAEDFQFQSKGRVTEWGYEVEVRVPFKSMRYQALPVQDWGIQVMREVQHSQHNQTWTQVRKANQSFLAQGGKLKGLTQLKRGLVMDLNPTVTTHTDGSRAPAPASNWNYKWNRPDWGGNVRWGITTDLTLNATANPDFSQVESDVQQVQYDPRSAVSFPEKRPFFVEGSEQFDAPHNLIYTRRMVQPVAALKLNGRAAGMNVGFLAALDEHGQSAYTADPNNPRFGILRLKKDVGRQSTIAITGTDRTDGSRWSRVASADVRLVLPKNYAFTGSYAHSFNHTPPVSGTGAVVNTNGPIWRFNVDRTGRRYTASYNIQGTHPRFATTAGFVSRTNIASASMDQRFTTYGKPGSILESHTFTFNVSSTWWYDSLLALAEWNDPKLHLNNSFSFKGGWRATTNVFIETFRYDPNLYRNYYIERTLTGGAKDTVPYVGVHRILNIDISQSFNTPQFSTFRGAFNVIWGRDENFEEWSPAFIMFPTVTLNWNPSTKLRAEFRYPLQLYVRLSDWTTVKRRQIPRLKVEFQASRAIFLRFVGQYDSQFRDSLRDDSRTNFPVLIRSGNTYNRNTLVRRNDLRVDWLFSYQPRPGTVFFAGYGASMGEPQAFRFSDLTRSADGFFVKLSYLYRL